MYVDIVQYGSISCSVSCSILEVVFKDYIYISGSTISLSVSHSITD